MQIPTGRFQEIADNEDIFPRTVRAKETKQKRSCSPDGRNYIVLEGPASTIESESDRWRNWLRIKSKKDEVLSQDSYRLLAKLVHDVLFRMDQDALHAAYHSLTSELPARQMYTLAMIIINICEQRRNNKSSKINRMKIAKYTGLNKYRFKESNGKAPPVLAFVLAVSDVLDIYDNQIVS